MVLGDEFEPRHLLSLYVFCRKLVPCTSSMPAIPSYQGYVYSNVCPFPFIIIYAVSESGLIAYVSLYPTQSICAPLPICPASVLYPPRLCLVPFLIRLACASFCRCFVRWMLYSTLAYIVMQPTILILSPVFQHFCFHRDI